MEQPSNPTIKSSGLPRLSRLPIPQTSKQPKEEKQPVKRNLQNRIGQQTAAKDALPFIGSVKVESKKATESRQPLEGISRNEPSLHDEKEAAGSAYDRSRTLHRKPRPSLSDRTIETLSQVPPSPSPRRRKSSFFPPESPSRPPSRPGSSLNRSRPSTSHGQHPPLPSGFLPSRPESPTKRQPPPKLANQTAHVTPSRRSVSSYVPKSLPQLTTRHHAVADSTPSKIKPPVPSSASWAQKQVAPTGPKQMVKPMRGSKTLAARPLKQRPSIQDAFAGADPLPRDIGLKKGRIVKAPNVTSPTRSTESSDAIPAFSTSPKSSSRTSSDSGQPITSKLGSASSGKIPSSSATLRETIAKAKAARQKATKLPKNAAYGANEGSNAFPGIEVGGDDGSLLRKRVALGRTEGRLNIAALGLKEIPTEVTNMYNENLGDGAWYESVDLVRLVAADNEFEQLSETCFPDRSVGMRDDDEDYQGNLFAGLETLDLHGNRLKTIPVGLRRLEHLTTLNLSKNGLGNDSLNTISQISSLRELRLAENALDTLSDIFVLSNLEVLDVHDNAISVLNSDIQNLANLHILNISGNKMKSLPLQCLDSLIELDAAKNRLSGCLFAVGVELRSLKTLNVGNNALTSMIDEGTICLPCLQTLDITDNRLHALPDISGWTQLLTLTASGNKLSTIPEGLASLSHLKTVDLARNDIKKIDEQIGFMDSLTVFRVGNNPLRERRYLNMDCSELKRDLKARVTSDNLGDHQGDETLENDSAGLLPGSGETNIRTWPVGPGGVLDRSSTKLENVEASDLEPLVALSDIKSLVLHQNLLSKIPQAATLVAHSLTSLDISNNKLANSSYIDGALLLPNLKSLDFSSNAIHTLSPFVDHLSAPKLANLNVSRNRLASLPPLRRAFPSLVSLSAANNSICGLEVDVVRGLQVLDVSGNDIDHLEPKLGLLGAEGLRTLVIGGNRFRVPRKDIIDKGTDAVLTWLRSRVPDGEDEL